MYRVYGELMLDAVSDGLVVYVCYVNWSVLNSIGQENPSKSLCFITLLVSPLCSLESAWSPFALVVAKCLDRVF